MRFDRLDLIAFGALTARTVSLRPDAKLHLVYGPNEAGKSTVRQAVAHLLFGFPQRKDFDFLHEASALRIGASLRRSDGTALAFRRRRGTKSTLLSADDAERPLNDDALAPFIGTVSRSAFENAFGLDSHALRRGAEEMLRLGGEAAGTLFAVASGLSSLTRLRSGLDAEADTLFSTRKSSSRKFYEVLQHYDDAHGVAGAHELRASEWKSLLSEIGTCESVLTALRDQRSSVRTDLLRLERLLRVHPLVRDLDHLAGEAHQYADLAPLAPEIAGQIEAAHGREIAAQQVVRQAGEAIADLGRRMDALVVNQPVLAASHAITELFARIEDYRSKSRDLPRIRGEREQFASQIAGFAQALGKRDEEGLLQSVPTQTALADLEGLIAQGERHLLDRERLEQDRQAASDELAGMEAGAGVPVPMDTRVWRERLEALGEQIELVAELSALQVEVAGRQRQLRESCSRLRPAVVDLEALALVALPDTGAVNRCRDRIQSAASEVVAQDRRRAALDGDMERLAGEIAADESGLPIPSPEAISGARQARDRSLAELRDAVESGGSPGAAHFDRVESLVLTADRLADAATTEAERVSRHAARVARRAVLGSELEAIAKLQAGAREEEGRARAEYLALFAETGIAPTRPDEMVEWLNAVRALLAERNALLALADRAASLETTASRLLPSLRAIASAVGAGVTDDLSVPALERLIALRLKALSEEWSASRTQEGKRQAIRSQLERTGTALAAKLGEHDEWLARFGSALAAVGLPDQTSLAGAKVAITLWGEVIHAHTQMQNRSARVEGMQRDMEAFEHDVSQIVRNAAPDLADLPADGAVLELQKRLNDALAAASSVLALQGELEAGTGRLAAAERDAEQARLHRARLMADLPPQSDIAETVARLKRRDALLVRLEGVRERLADAHKGTEIEDIRKQLENFDPDDAAARLDELAAAEARLGAEENEAYARLRDARQRREALEQGGGVEQAAFLRNAAEAELVEVSRHWLTTRLAAAILGAGIERHREANADPMITRAGQLLEQLTAGSMSGLIQQFGEDDVPRLAAIRASGEPVGISDMSEGTRDQLYLALRLAYLENFSHNNEPMPFIGDDIFQTFDDERAERGLHVLAETSRSFQTILFTHHRSVADTAVRALGDDLDLVEW